MATGLLGTPGYQASVDYIADALRSHGFDVQTPEFDLRLPFADPPTVTVGGANFAGKPLRVHHRHATRRCHRTIGGCASRGHPRLHGERL